MKYVLSLALLLTSGFCFSADTESQKFKIGKIFLAGPSDLVYIYPEGEVEAIRASCSNQTRYAFHIDAKLGKEMLAGLFMASAADTDITVYIDTSTCLSSQQKVNKLVLHFDEE